MRAESLVLDRVSADEFKRRVKSGRTRPIILGCEADTGTSVELVCKLSDGCDQGIKNLAREVVAACLAHDLGLPVLKPYLVDISPEFIAVLDASKPEYSEISERLRRSSSVAFGSNYVPRLPIWNSGNRVSGAMEPVAQGILVFDGAIENADRRVDNPNCFVSGDRIFIIDHEMAFPQIETLFNRKPPWKLGGLDWLDGSNKADRHLFCEALKGRRLDFAYLVDVWCGVTDSRLKEYRNAIPPEWEEALPAVDEALMRIRNSRDNICEILTEIGRVLQ